MVGSVLPVLVRHPSSIHQFLGHVGQQMHPSYRDDLRVAWRDGRSFLFLIFAGAVVGAVDFARHESRAARLDWLESYGVALAFSLLIALRLPRHPYYFWSAPPVLVPAAVVTIARFWGRGVYLKAYALGATLLAFSALAALDFLKETLIVAALSSDQRPQVNADTIRRLLPAHARIAAGELWGELGNEYRFRSPNHDPLPLDKLDYVLFWARGQRQPGVTGKVPGDAVYFAQHFRLIYDNLPRERTKLFGLPASSGFWGFGPSIYENVEHALLRSKE
jgi:hypothetical protein